jgi:hypothetical protein
MTFPPGCSVMPHATGQRRDQEQAAAVGVLRAGWFWSHEHAGPAVVPHLHMEDVVLLLDADLHPGAGVYDGVRDPVR